MKHLLTFAFIATMSTTSISMLAQSNVEQAKSKAMQAIQLEDEQGKYDEAIALFQEAQKLDPANISYPYEEAYAYSGKKEYTNLKEKGFYNQIVASSSMVSIHTDSISLNMEQKKFSFYGKQMITRKSAVITRKLVTEGFFEDIIRSPNNPHGVMLKNWRIIDNEEISNQTKNSY